MRKIELLIDDNGYIEVVLNVCYGGFGLSKEAILRMIELGSEEAKGCYDDTIKNDWPTNAYHPDVVRWDPILVRVVKELKNKASGPCAELAIGKIKLVDLMHIYEHDGKEEISGCYDYKSYGRYEEDV